MNGAGQASATQSSAMAGAVNYAAWVLDPFRPFIGRRLVEIGVGHGQYRPLLGGLTFHGGVDIDPAAVALAAAADPVGHYLAGDVADPALVARVLPWGCDTVLCVNVLEHVERDAQAVANLVGMVAPGGHVLLFVPALPALYNDLDRLAGHRRRYTRGGVAQLAAGLPVTLVRLHYFNALGGVGWWLNRFRRCASLEEGAVRGQVALFDRFGVPLARLLEPFTRQFFGQSLVAVLRREPLAGPDNGERSQNPSRR